MTVRRGDDQTLQDLGVMEWPIWACEPSTFDWQYDQREVCYLTEGEAVVTANGEDISIAAGDLVTFPEGMHCTWTVREPIRKHYRLG
ncbi:MAG: cupin domain-containing protein [Phycisphaerae bacterium]